MILNYVNLLKKENHNDNNINKNGIFLLNNDNNDNKNNIIYKINIDIINENLFNNNNNYLEDYHLFFNGEILNQFDNWEKDLNDNIINNNNEEKEYLNSKFKFIKIIKI